jgi:hypothetical protein
LEWALPFVFVLLVVTTIVAKMVAFAVKMDVPAKMVNAHAAKMANVPV